MATTTNYGGKTQFTVASGIQDQLLPGLKNEIEVSRGDTHAGNQTNEQTA
ncbi:MAG TPA: hypothetical protein HA254_01520 [Candidatus Diapherotrites archaeon]|uniref:Uncharacterized protein n=1 Tax=Candidatus Iainarchaeum sp. TaxID=3101447 RepID=A0A7J4IUW3_9ARCH|nr:hypothetical protein [Candidatus Diapherotrites archaeon]